jgi:hypothetical protein
MWIIKTDGIINLNNVTDITKAGKTTYKVNYTNGKSDIINEYQYDALMKKLKQVKQVYQ